MEVVDIQLFLLCFVHLSETFSLSLSLLFLFHVVFTLDDGSLASPYCFHTQGRLHLICQFGKASPFLTVTANLVPNTHQIPLPERATT